MTAALREYVLKGLFLGLWAYLALVHPAWSSVWRVVGYLIAGFAVGFVLGIVQQILRGYRPFRNPPGFLLLVLLDSPFCIYFGVIGGLTAGLFLERPPDVEAETFQAILGTMVTSPIQSTIYDWLGYFAIGGALLGFGFHRLAGIKDKLYRLVIGAVVGALGVYLAIGYIDDFPSLADKTDQQRFATILLLGLPFFYLLAFCGETEESEVEIAALCAGLGVGLYLLRLSSELPESGDKLIFLVPLIVYYVYVVRVQPGLRVFKHTLRGYGNLSLGRVQEAIASFGRALQLDKKNDLAMKGLFDLHRKVDVSKLDGGTQQLLNFDFCLKLAQGHLIQDRAPTVSEREEAVRLLDTVEKYKPALMPRTDYLKAVAQTHAKDFDLAAGYLNRLLDPEQPYVQAVRQEVLYPAFGLALRQHPELVRRLGDELLEKPGRRMEAISTVERQLAANPADAEAMELRQSLYSTLKEPEFVSACSNGPPEFFNYEYAEQLGLALLDGDQPDRGMGYLRMAGRGLPSRGPGLFTKLAEVATARGHTEEAHGYWDQVKRSGLTAGPARLTPDQQAFYFAGLRKLIDEATARGDYDAAIDNQRLLIEGGKEDVNTLRQLADLHAKSGDVLNALLIVERGLIYSKADADLLAKKESYYFSVDPERVRAAKDKIASWFDVAYCTRKVQAVSNLAEPDLDTLDWGLHLAKLARIVQPNLHSVMVAEARIMMRKGERDAAIQILEDIREQPKGSGDEEDAWFLATRLLADLYLNELSRPDLAIQAYTSYREYQKSGAETLFQLARAYEANNNIPAAIQIYEAVTAYEKHPRYYDATEAVRKLKGN